MRYLAVIFVIMLAALAFALAVKPVFARTDQKYLAAAREVGEGAAAAGAAAAGLMSVRRPRSMKILVKRFSNTVLAFAGVKWLTAVAILLENDMVALIVTIAWLLVLIPAGYFTYGLVKAFESKLAS